MVKSFRLREEWLRRVGDLMAARIEEAAEAPLPKWRASCGFMSNGIKSKAIGQCWNPESSGDGSTEIFITPRMDDARKVAATLAHEMIHAALPGIGHGKPFARAAKAIGFAAPITKYNPTDDLWAWIDPILDQVGAYPHAELSVIKAEGGPKKQTTRHLKVTCEHCGYNVRVAKKWIVEVGPPHCPKEDHATGRAHGPMRFDYQAVFPEAAGEQEEDDILSKYGPGDEIPGSTPRRAR